MDENVIEEYDEYIIINGRQLKKPFVEKPVDADDHNVPSLPRSSRSQSLDIHLLPHVSWRRKQALVSKDKRSE
jgi:hypothetical protein